MTARTARTIGDGDLFGGLLAPLLFALCLLLFGCATHPPTGTTINLGTTTGSNITGSVTFPVASNIDLAITGGGTPGTGEWNAGISIIFKTQPDPVIVSKLTAAGFVRERGSETWNLPKANAANGSVQRAVLAALEVPGTSITRYIRGK